ncbi:MAG: DNRLRE domain-containing protein [bacterium]|nr:DNRLRE domain-containing protein [bacterium]
MSSSRFHLFLKLLPFLVAVSLCAPANAAEVTLVSPPDGAVVNNTSVSFTCSATDASGLSSAALYIGNDPQTLTFSGTAETADAYLTASSPNSNNGSGSAITVDGQNPHAHAVIKFPYIFGEGRVPLGSSIVSATLDVRCSNPGNVMKLYRLREDWLEGEVTWNRRAAGVLWSNPGADGPGSHASVALDGNCTATGWRTIDVTFFVQEWSNGEPNYGVVLTDTGTDGVNFDSSETANPPALRVTYQTRWQDVQTSPMSGTSDRVEFAPVDLTDQASYAWNCLVTNGLNQQSWAPADFHLSIDSHLPDLPVLASPPDGAFGVSTSPTLEVTVSDPDGEPLDVTFYGRGGSGEKFTIIALPDTQYYSQSYPQIFTAQTQWIVDNVAARNIVFVTHEGDLVQTWNNTTQWARANTSMGLLDGVVPYGVSPGNHDQPTTYYNQYFPYTRYEDKPWYGGHRGTTNDTNCELFSAGGTDYIVLQLEFWPSSEVIAWADSVLKTHADRKAIITTHGFLGEDGSRNVHVMGSTQYIWDDLVVPNDNVYFVLCGHVHGEYARTDVVNGREVHQLLADYQDGPNGGNGFLRIMRFVPAENKVYVQTYSPWLDQYETDSDSEFTLNFPMSGYSLISADEAVASGGNASVVWTGLSANTLHEWYVEVTDPTNRTQVGPIWTFATTSGDITPPTISDVDAVFITDDSARIVWTTDEPSDSVVDYGTSTDYGQTAVDLPLVTSHSVVLTGLTPETTYHYRVSSKDSAENVAYSDDYIFTTLPVIVMGPSIPSPPGTPVPLETEPDSEPSEFAEGIYNQDVQVIRLVAAGYDLQTGRRIAKGSIRFVAGNPNLYAYVRNDPMNHVGPAGMQGRDPLAGHAAQIDSIIEVLSRDAAFRNQLEILSDLGPYSGLARNFFLASMGFGPSLSRAGDAYDFVRTAIAERGAEIINRAIENGALDGVLGAELIHRHEPLDHDAIRVQFEDGDEVVLDF